MIRIIVEMHPSDLRNPQHLATIIIRNKATDDRLGTWYAEHGLYHVDVDSAGRYAQWDIGPFQRDRDVLQLVKLALASLPEDF